MRATQRLAVSGRVRMRQPEFPVQGAANLRYALVHLIARRRRHIMADKKTIAKHSKALAESKQFATKNSNHDAFGSFAATASGWLGSKWAFLGAIVIIVVWACSGPVFHFSDTWQLVINTGTTIVTFLMVFLIQNTQNRDAKAINLKLNELIYATAAAGDQMLDIEKLSDEELNTMQVRYEQIRAECIRREGATPEQKSTTGGKR
jgi:low affinity Fe/Cu permease